MDDIAMPANCFNGANKMHLNYASNVLWITHLSGRPKNPCVRVRCKLGMHLNNYF